MIIGRPLTPEELAEFEAIRKASTGKAAKAFGMTVERHEKFRRKAAEEVHSDDNCEKNLTRETESKQ